MNCSIDDKTLNAALEAHDYARDPTFLGSGAFGNVYKITDQMDTFACKVMPASDDIKEEWENELNVLRAFTDDNMIAHEQNHHIIKYHNHFEFEGYIFIVTEYVDGDTAAVRCRKQELKLETVRSITCQVLHGLQLIHSKGIIHRDIKGANIMINSQKTVKIIDFGIALNNTSTGGFKGSPYWMSPEVIQELPATDRSDIWSLGCLVHELITGSPPNGSMSAYAAIFQTVEMPMPIPAGIPKEVEQFLKKCFKKNPEERPSAIELLNDDWIIKEKQSDFVTYRNFTLIKPSDIMPSLVSPKKEDLAVVSKKLADKSEMADLGEMDIPFLDNFTFTPSTNVADNSVTNFITPATVAPSLPDVSFHNLGSITASGFFSPTKTISPTSSGSIVSFSPSIPTIPATPKSQTTHILESTPARNNLHVESNVFDSDGFDMLEIDSTNQQHHTTPQASIEDFDHNVGQVQNFDSSDKTGRLLTNVPSIATVDVTNAYMSRLIGAILKDLDKVSLHCIKSQDGVNIILSTLGKSITAFKDVIDELQLLNSSVNEKREQDPGMEKLRLKGEMQRMERMEELKIRADTLRANQAVMFELILTILLLDEKNQLAIEFIMFGLVTHCNTLLQINNASFTAIWFVCNIINHIVQTSTTKLDHSALHMLIMAGGFDVIKSILQTQQFPIMIMAVNIIWLIAKSDNKSSLSGSRLLSLTVQQGCVASLFRSIVFALSSFNNHKEKLKELDTDDTHERQREMFPTYVADNATPLLNEEHMEGLLGLLFVHEEQYSMIIGRVFECISQFSICSSLVLPKICDSFEALYEAFIPAGYEGRTRLVDVYNRISMSNNLFRTASNSYLAPFLEALSNIITMGAGEVDMQHITKCIASLYNCTRMQPSRLDLISKELNKKVIQRLLSMRESTDAFSKRMLLLYPFGIKCDEKDIVELTYDGSDEKSKFFICRVLDLLDDRSVNISALKCLSYMHVEDVFSDQILSRVAFVESLKRIIMDQASKSDAFVQFLIGFERILTRSSCMRKVIVNSDDQNDRTFIIMLYNIFNNERLSLTDDKTRMSNISDVELNVIMSITNSLFIESNSPNVFSKCIQFDTLLSRLNSILDPAKRTLSQNLQKMFETLVNSFNQLNIC
ncbi:hypothetical protein PCE1_004881 [Barthelona sp. PCE]